MSVGILLPCVRFKAEVQPYGDDQPTPLEQAAMLFMGAKQPKLPVARDLASFLCIGKTATNDLLRDLWYRGWVHIDPASGALTLHREAEKFVALGNFTGMGSVQAPETLEFIYDLVAGQIAPSLGDAALRDAGSAAYTFPKSTAGGRRDAGHFFNMPLEGFIDISQPLLIEALTGHAHFRRYLRDADPAALHCRVLRPAETLRPAHVVYYRVYFDSFLTADDQIALEVNDTRPIQRKLGRGLCDSIVAVLPHAPQLSAMLRQAATGQQPAFETPRRVLRAFVEHTKAELDNAFRVDKIMPDVRALELWREVRQHVVNLVSGQVDLAKSHALPDRASVKSALRSSFSPTVSQAVIASPRMARNALIREEWTSDGSPVPGGSSILTEFEAQMRRGTLFLQTTTATPQDVVSAMPLPSDNFKCAYLEKSGPHTAASIAVFDHRDVLLASDALVGDDDVMGLRLRFGGDEEGSLPGLSTRRLLQRLDGNSSFRGGAHRMEIVSPLEQQRTPKLPIGLEPLVRHLDRDLAQLEDGEDAAETSGPSDPDPAALAAHRLRLRERHEIAEDLVNWVGRDSCAAEILIDADIHHQASGLLLETPAEAPIVIGLSTPRDLRDNADLMSVLRDRLNRPGCGQIVLCLPSDPRQKGLVDALRQELESFPNVSLQLSNNGARWGFGFVMSARECVIASDGVGRRVVSAGRARGGTQIGVVLHGAKLRDFAFDALARTHDMRACRALFDSVEEARPRPVFDLSNLFANWQAAGKEGKTNSLLDGNLGVGLVAPFLDAQPGMPWQPDDPALDLFDDNLRYAILKAAAIAGRDNAREAFAQYHWRRGNLFHAAVLAEDIPGSFLAEPGLRDMCFAVATGQPFTGAPPDALLLSRDYPHRNAFMMLAALLMLEGHGDQLVPWIASDWARENGVVLDHTPLERLVAALAERATDSPASAVTFLEAGLVETPPFEAVWDDLATYVEGHRAQVHASSSVRALSDTIYRDTGVATNALTNLILRAGTSMNRAARVKALWDLRAAHPGLFGNDPDNAAALLDPRRRKETARVYFEEMHKRMQLRHGLEPVAASVRENFHAQVNYIFEALFKLLLAGQHQRRDRELERAVLAAASVWSANEAPSQRKSDLSPLVLALNKRVSEPYRSFSSLAPPWIAPLAFAATQSDRNGLCDRLMQMEFPADPDVLRVIVNRSTAIATGGENADMPGGLAWQEAWKILQQCQSLPAELRDEAEFGSVLRDFRAGLAAIGRTLAEGVGALRRQKIRNNLVSTDFDRAVMDFNEALTKFRAFADLDDVLPAQDGLEALSRAQAAAASLREFYRAALSNGRDALAELVLDPESADGKARIGHVDELCRLGRLGRLDLGRLDVADWYLHNIADFEPVTPVKPDPSLQSRFLMRLGRGDAGAILGEFRNEVDDSALDFLGALASILVPLDPLRSGDALPKSLGDELFATLARFLGTSLTSRDEVRDDGQCWWLTTSNPLLMGLAPFLGSSGRSARIFSFAVPKSSTATRLFFDQLSGSRNWRSTVFDRASQDGDLGAAVEGGLGALGALLPERDEERPFAPALTPLTLTLFQRDGFDRAPSLTHLDLIGLAAMTPADRRRALSRSVARQVTRGNLVNWWQSPPPDEHPPGISLLEWHDRHKRSILEQILEVSWAELIERAPDVREMFGWIAQVADRLGIGLSAPPQGGASQGADATYALACLTYASAGSVLNAFDVFFEAIVETRHGRRYLDVMSALRNFEPDRALGKNALLRSLPTALHPDENGWARARSLVEALQLATEGDGFVRIAVVDDLLREDAAWSSTARNWRELALRSGIIESQGTGYKVARANGLMSLLCVL